MTIQEHIDYWNIWTEKWFELASINFDSCDMPPIEFDFNGLLIRMPILKVLDGTNVTTQKEWCWKFFPEPYWGIPNSNRLHGVFINFNPGAGGHSQHIKTSVEWNMVKSLGASPLSCHEIWKRFPLLNYHYTIKELYNKKDYVTTDWMIKNRQSFMTRYNLEFGNQIEDNPEYVMFELCPWHTTKVTGKVYKYIRTYLDVIDKHIIDFAFECAKSTKGTFRNLILSHGLDKNTVKKQCKIDSLLLVTSESEEIGITLRKSWDIDVYTKKNTGVYLLNFKNSSNGFPAVNEDLRKIIEKYQVQN